MVGWGQGGDFEFRRSGKRDVLKLRAYVHMEHGCYNTDTHMMQKEDSEYLAILHILCTLFVMYGI